MSLPLLDWYDQVKRDLPWRRTSDPYAVWVSEIMLQQTTVAAVTPYFERWMKRFPTLASLAEAPEEEALALWQGLGYYRRARMLLAGARSVAERGLPQTAEEWRKIPGVGAYTAGAISSIAQGQREALVDGNVERVYARLCADPSLGPALNKRAWEWAKSQLPLHRAGDYNQALMELGATVCTPKTPKCQECPCQALCEAHRRGEQEAFPSPKSKPEVISLTHHVWAVEVEGRWAFSQIPKGQWWEGLWEMPRRSDPGGEEALLAWLGDGEVIPVGVHRHTVTKHRIALHVSWTSRREVPEGLDLFLPVEVDELPLPAPQRRAWEMIKKARASRLSL